MAFCFSFSDWLVWLEFWSWLVSWLICLSLFLMASFRSFNCSCNSEIYECIHNSIEQSFTSILLLFLEFLKGKSPSTLHDTIMRFTFSYKRIFEISMLVLNCPKFRYKSTSLGMMFRKYLNPQTFIFSQVVALVNILIHLSLISYMVYLFIVSFPCTRYPKITSPILF